MVKIIKILLFFSLSLFAKESFIDVITTNDLHGFLGEQDAYFMNPNFPPKIVGASALYKYIKDVEKKLPNKSDDILIFDEATSSVDNKTERLIQKSFKDIKQDRTMIIIAHRLSTIRNCDNIYVIKDSRIHEQGTHDQLMELSDSFYAELWNIQTGKKL